MNNYYNLELDILSCLVQKPELMRECILEDKYFIKYKSLWIYLKSFYKKFGTFDLVLMTTVAKDKFKMIDFIEKIIDREPAPSNFKKYQGRLMEMYLQKQTEKQIKIKIFNLATDLLMENIDLEEFSKKTKKIEENLKHDE